MDQSVIIKGFTHGISVILDPSCGYEALKEKVAVKFRDSAKFLGSAQMALKFEGFKPDDAQKKELLEIITKESSLNIICILEDDAETEALMADAVAKSAAGAYNGNDLIPDISRSFSDGSFNGTFYKGSLRSGMEENFAGNGLIIGDVHPGASVTARGSIFILGSLRGTAHAGTDGDVNAFVLALDMAPVQIRIADTIARSPDHPARSDQKEPQIAFLEDGAIYIEPVTKKVLSERTI